MDIIDGYYWADWGWRLAILVFYGDIKYIHARNKSVPAAI
jgi:hypothetical protein